MRLVPVLLVAVLAVPARAAVDHVIFVSVDGLRADLLEDLLDGDVAGDYASFRRLVDEGVSTFHARTDYSITKTIPNHACMVTGRPAEQPEGQDPSVPHGYTSNSFPEPEDTLHNAGNPALSYVPGIFDVVHDHGMSTGLYASKEKFVLFDRSYDAEHGAPDVTGADDGPDKIDVYHYAESGVPATAAPMHAALVADLATNPAALTFVSYRDPDSAGHDFLWGSEVWNDAVRAVDGYLGEILAVVESDPRLRGSTTVIVTADHGGAGTGHSDPEGWRNYTIPFFVWGPGVPARGDLYALNAATRADPASGNPDYNAAVAPVRNGDGANLALALLGLPPVPGSTINGEQDLFVGDVASGVSGPSALPDPGLLARPNPFRDRAKITFELVRPGAVRLTLHDVSGRTVRVLTEDGFAAGRHAIGLSARGLGAGIYFVRLESGSLRQNRKLVLLR